MIDSMTPHRCHSLNILEHSTFGATARWLWSAGQPSWLFRAGLNNLTTQALALKAIPSDFATGFTHHGVKTIARHHLIITEGSEQTVC